MIEVFFFIRKNVREFLEYKVLHFLACLFTKNNKNLNIEIATKLT